MRRTPMGLMMMVVATLAAAAPAATQQVLYYTPSEQGFVWDWLVSFRHPYPYKYVGCSLEYDALADMGGERKSLPVEGMPAGKGGNWQAYHHEVGAGWTGVVMEFPPCSMHMTYAATYLVCDREVTNVSLRTGSDDGLLVLLNGELVQKVQMQRGYNVEQDRVDGLTLRKGWNTLLCKVDDYMGGHGLCLHLKTGDGKPFTDCKVVLVPAPAAGTTVELMDGKKYEAEAMQLLKQAVQLKTINNDAGGALEAAGSVVTRFPASKAAAEALFLKARILRETGKEKESGAALDRLIKDFPFARWAEDALVMKAEMAQGQAGNTEAVAALEALLRRYDKSPLVPEAMLSLAAIKARNGQWIESASILDELRARFPQTIESVKALDRMADNKAGAGDREQARKLWTQVIEEADALAAGKYIWYVNVQTALKEIADAARTKKGAKQ